MSAEANKAVARRYLDEVFNQANLDVIQEVIAPDYLEHSGSPHLPSRGHESVRASVSVFRTAFPDLRIEIQDLLADGDRVVCRNVGTGTFLGEFFGIPPTGRAGAMTGIHIYRLENGRIAEHWANSDDFGLLQQLGVIPTSAPA
jgi:steroid delta-isomerase-like uncharacterized protein